MADRTSAQQVRTDGPGGVGSSVQAGRPLLDSHQEQGRHMKRSVNGSVLVKEIHVPTMFNWTLNVP